MAHRDGGVLPLPKARYGIAISWDRAKACVDLDLQALIVDEHGLIVDAVFYNNLYAFGGCVGHSGDKRVMDGKEYSESVWVNLNKLPKQVALIIFVVAAYGDCMLKDVTGGKISVLEDFVGNRLRESKIERAMADVDAVYMMRRQDSTNWKLIEIEEPPAAGSHFMDILEPTIGDLIRKEIPGAPAVQKVTFLMEKGAAVDFQQSTALKRLVVGISGKLHRGYVGSVDIDVSAVLFSKEGKVVGAIDCDSSHGFGVSHSGDYTAGHNSGDDEVIMIDLLQVPQKVTQMFFLLTVRGGETFQSVDSAYARVADQACMELARYEIVGGAPENGLIIARIFRTSDKRWSIEALGMFCIAENWQQAKGILKELFKETPEKVQGPGDGKPLGFSRRFANADAKRLPSKDPGPPRGAGVAEDSGDRGVRTLSNRSNTRDSAELHVGRAPSGRSRCITARSDVDLDSTGTRAASKGSACRTRSTSKESSSCRTSSVREHAEAGGDIGRRVSVKHGTFRLTSEPMPCTARAGAAERPLKFKLDMPDSDMVPVDDGGTTVAAAKPRGICAGGCPWASRLQLFGGCAGGAAN